MDDMFPGAHGKLNIELPEKSQKPQPKQGKDTRSYSNPQAESEPEVVGSVHHPNEWEREQRDDYPCSRQH